MTRRPGRDLAVGDIIGVWMSPGKARINRLFPYRGPYEDTILKGARIAELINLTRVVSIEMTIPADQYFEVYR